MPLLSLEPTAAFRNTFQVLAVVGGSLLIYAATRKRVETRHRAIIIIVGGLTIIADGLFLLLS